MPKRIRNMTGVVAGLAALALGGSALAGAAQNAPVKAANPPATQESTAGPDTDNVQSGDQTAPDMASSATAASESTSGPDTDNVQSGDQTTPDRARGASATKADAPTAGDQADSSAGETPGSESATGDDGPGGHADEPGNPNANNQSQGQN